MGERRIVPFGAAVLLAAAVLSPGVESRTSTSLTWHMAQHVVLLSIVPPLVILGLGRPRPLPTTPAIASTAVAAHTFVLLSWHAPSFYVAAEQNLGAHVVEHLCFIGAGLVLWTAVLARRSLSGPLLLFAAALPGTALGAALTFANHPWYSAYPNLASQQLAGVVMWSGGGLVYLAGAAAVTARLLQVDVAR